MKVGILTFHSVSNYGAVLQAEALQKVIFELGHDCDVIDYRSKYFAKLYRPIHLDDFKHPRRLVRNIRMAKHKVDTNKAMTRFVQRYLNLSSKKYSEATIGASNAEYDVFVVGSDQVWSMKINGGDAHYFLDFVAPEKKRVSYAASVSTSNLTEEEKAFFHAELSRYHSISVREASAQKQLSQFIAKPIEVCLDPTLLIDRKHWYELSSQKDEAYVLLYVMSSNEQLTSYAKALAKKNGLKLKYISLYEPKLDDAEMVFAPNVEEWVSLFRNANYVITNSFHGMAFSIVFHKYFQYAPLNNNGKNTRILDMLSELGFDDRMVEYGDFKKIEVPIDYDKVDKILERRRLESIAYLSQALNKEELLDED